MEKKGYTDLHLHLDGSLSADAVRKLAEMQNMELPSSDQALKQQLQVDSDCQSLTDYLKCFDYALTFLQTEPAIEESVYLLLQECKQLGLAYVEVRFAPQLHLQKGLSQRQVVEAAIRGKNRSSLPSGLILCCMRGTVSKDNNLETVRLASEYLERGVCAVDIAGDEAHYPLELYTEELTLAKELSIPLTIHAGEADGPKSVWKALSFGAKRIGHGVRSIEDPALMQELAARGVVLELCPTSNLNTKVFEQIEDYPLRQFMEAGVKITINSDNMMVSDTDAIREMKLLEKTFGLTEEEIDCIKQNGKQAAFLSILNRKKKREV